MSEHIENGGVVSFGNFEVDPKRRELRKNGRPIRIQDQPFEVLSILIEHAGEVVTRDELRRRVWAADTFVVFEDSLNTAVRKAREALGETAGHPRFIETVPRRGYRFIAPLGNGHVEHNAAAPAPVPRRTITSRGLLWRASLVGVAVTVVFAAVWMFVRQRSKEPDVVSFQIQIPEATTLPPGGPSLAISPDGRQVAFLAVSLPRMERRVWVQSLDSPSAHPVPNTEYAFDPFWSPDGRSIAFHSYGKLRRLDLDTGTSVVLTDRAEASGGSWSDRAGILVPGRGTGLLHLDPSTGAAQPVTTLDAAREETQHIFPHILPDGRSFIYLALSRRPERAAIYLARLGEAGRTWVVDACCRAMFAEPDRLLFVRGSRLLSQRLDVRSGTVSGEPVEIASGVLSMKAAGRSEFAVSRGAPLVFARPPHLPVRELVWMNRSGQRLSVAAAADYDRAVQLSPDARWALVERPDVDSDTSAPDIWLLDLERGGQSRVTTSSANDEAPVWAPDSQRFVYARHRAIHQVADLYVKERGSADVDAPFLVDDTGSKHPSDWSADGRVIFYDMEDDSGKRNIWLLPVADRKPMQWLATPADERAARVSHNVRWVAYESDEGGRTEIYVRALDRPEKKWQISTSGGTQPRWRGDDGELYFVSGDFQLMAAPVHVNAQFSAEAPHALFELRRLSATPATQSPYDLSADGLRFLVGAVREEGTTAPLIAIVNWRSLAFSAR